MLLTRRRPFYFGFIFVYLVQKTSLLCERYGDRHYEAARRRNLADMRHQVGAETAAQE